MANRRETHAYICGYLQVLTGTYHVLTGTHRDSQVLTGTSSISMPDERHFVTAPGSCFFVCFLSIITFYDLHIVCANV